ncbi:MAG: diversity-generating retroelement protein Avd [Deltaproteobacteria bacterium]|nr:diversity-generating retroelement protein Avd [Deltaproteobacteria bacterium]
MSDPREEPREEPLEEPPELLHRRPPLEAPLFTKTYDLVLWLDERTEQFPKSQRFGAAARLTRHAVEALEAITLALRGFERPENVDRADAALALLRVHLKLAADRHLISERQMLHALGRVEELGRMLGGWRKRL